MPLTVYIDEAGDPGVRDGLRYAVDRHEWLCISAVVVRTTLEAEAVEWVKEMRTAANSTQAGALHYHKIAIGRRLAVCETLASKPVKVFCLASHKSNLREYVNERIGKMLDAGIFYNWCLRLLLERVTAWAEEWLQQEVGGLHPLKVIFAERGGHDYAGFFSYVDTLRMQSENGTLFLKGKGLAPTMLDRSDWIVRRAETLAGLQLADTAASAFYQAANTASPSWALAPAQALKRVVAEDKKSAANFGLTVWPLPHQAELPEASRQIFRHYGYSF